ncbi:putative integral membrane sensor protein [Caballeronia hypogeia]|uniref:Integral membrane sensor protein n=1 Tax=Caballeronia hypogeia TaxID=1777140 RepID=A0A157ZXE6_9BURK|nr:MASE1 domain-containing protein [Caballeronia hypogeia]SAK50106.1 putative integral membrane sensor protein [Caballeronia hypogeia]
MRRSSSLVGLLWAIPYFIAACVSAALSAGTGASAAASVWLPAGVAMAALMLTRPRGWFAVIPALVGAQFAFGLLRGVGAVDALLVAIALAAAPAVALAIVVRFARTPLSGLYFLRALFLAALIDSALAICIDVTLHAPALFGLPPDAPMRALAHFVGIFVLTPVFTAWSRFRPSRRVAHGVTERVIGAIAFVALVPCALFAFEAPVFGQLASNLAVGLSYVPLVLCVVISLMWDARGGAMSVLALAIIALLQTVTGHGPFASTLDDSSLIGAQIYVATASVLVLLTTTLHGHRERAMERAHRWRTNIELALAGSGQLVYCLDARSGRIEWAGDIEAIAGYDARELATQEAVLAIVATEDRARLRAQWLRAAAGVPGAEMTFTLRTDRDTLVAVTDHTTPTDDLGDGPGFIVGIWRKAAQQPESAVSAEVAA